MKINSTDTVQVNIDPRCFYVKEKDLYAYNIQLIINGNLNRTAYVVNSNCFLNADNKMEPIDLPFEMHKAIVNDIAKANPKHELYIQDRNTGEISKTDMDENTYIKMLNNNLVNYMNIEEIDDFAADMGSKFLNLANMDERTQKNMLGNLNLKEIRESFIDNPDFSQPLKEKILEEIEFREPFITAALKEISIKPSIAINKINKGSAKGKNLVLYLMLKQLLGTLPEDHISIVKIKDMINEIKSSF